MSPGWPGYSLECPGRAGRSGWGEASLDFLGKETALQTRSRLSGKWQGTKYKCGLGIIGFFFFNINTSVISLTVPL